MHEYLDFLRKLVKAFLHKGCDWKLAIAVHKANKGMNRILALLNQDVRNYSTFLEANWRWFGKWNCVMGKFFVFLSKSHKKYLRNWKKSRLDFFTKSSVQNSFFARQRQKIGSFGSRLSCQKCRNVWHSHKSFKGVRAIRDCCHAFHCQSKVAIKDIFTWNVETFWPPHRPVQKSGFSTCFFDCCFSTKWPH